MNPLEDWKDVLGRFPQTKDDIEESEKCFACDRYTAAVFHALQVTEAGLVEFGDLIGVENPKRGWGPTNKQADRLLETKYTDLKTSEQQLRPLVEQIKPFMLAMQTAWRDKISHADNRLVVIRGEFKPQVAKDIMLATQAFMRRLAMDMPLSPPVSA